MAVDVGGLYSFGKRVHDTTRGRPALASAKGFTMPPEGGPLQRKEARLLANLLVEGCKVAGERRERLERERR
jgi:hypothetical protein